MYGKGSGRRAEEKMITKLLTLGGALTANTVHSTPPQCRSPQRRKKMKNKELQELPRPEGLGQRIRLNLPIPEELRIQMH